MGDPNQPQRPEDLPVTLFPILRRPLREANPAAVERLATEPQRLLPLPSGLDESKAKRMRNLAQYHGRSVAGQKRSLGNLPTGARNDMSNVLAKTEPADVPIPMAFIEPPGLDTVRGRATRACMSQEEYRLYEETWKRYMKVHEEDFNDAEDTDDLHMICMEMVIQHRLEMKQLAKPSQIPTQEYDRSVRRQQTARENLAARRADRLAAKSGRGRGTNINIAVLAGGVDQAKLLEQRKQQALTQEQEEQQFLQHSRESLSGERVEIIDVQPQEPDTGGK